VSLSLLAQVCDLRAVVLDFFLGDFLHLFSIVAGRLAAGLGVVGLDCAVVALDIPFRVSITALMFSILALRAGDSAMDFVFWRE